MVAQVKIPETILHYVAPHHIVSPNKCLILSTRITFHTYGTPPPNLNYFSVGSNSTPSSTPTESMAGLGQLEIEINPSTNRGMWRK